MHVALVELLATVRDRPECRQEAILRLGLILEAKNWPSDPQTYVQMLPADLRALVVSEQDEAELVAAVAELIASADFHAHRVSLLWIVSNAAPSIGIGALLEIVERDIERFSDDEVYQLLLAVDRIVAGCRGAERDVEHPGGRRELQVVASLQRRDPRQRLTALANTRGRRVGEAAINAWRSTQLALGTPEEQCAVDAHSSSTDFARTRLMKPVLKQLIADAATNTNPRRQRDAIDEIATLLSTWKRDSPQAAANTLLPERMRTIAFDDDDEQDLVAELHKLLLDDELATSGLDLLSALRAASPRYGLHPALDLLANHTTLSAQERCCLLETLDTMLDALWTPGPHDGAADSHIALIVALHNPRSILKDIALDPDPTIAVTARSIAQRLDRAATTIAPPN